MRKSRKFALTASACLSILAVAIAGTIGILKVSANGGLSEDVTVTMVDPAPRPALKTVTVYTDDGQPPIGLGLEVEVDVTPLMTMGVTPTVDGVDFALNAATLNGSATTADDVSAGVTSNPSGMPSEWSGILNLGAATNYVLDTLVTPNELVSESVISALASISGAYSMSPGRASVSAYDEYDVADVDIVVINAADAGIDIDGNCKPDSEGLVAVPDGMLVCTGASGNPVITVWRPLDTSRGFEMTPELSVAFDTPTGQVFIDIVAPTLAAIQAVSTAYDGYDTGRLVISVAAVVTDLLDGPAGVDPLGEFVGSDPPQNLFALYNILLSDSTAPGTITQWLALKVLPTPLTIDTSFSGSAVEAALTAAAAAGSEAFAYTYETQHFQDGLPARGMTQALLTDEGAENGWLDVLFPFLNLTDEIAREAISAGDDTINVSLTSASVIAGSNITPALSGGGGGGGGGGSCFIATAAYGTPLADDINVLRSLRDSYMLNNAVGTAFVDMYYRLSPPVADSVAGNAAMKTVVRTLLAPIVIVGSFMLAMPGMSVLMVLAAAGFIALRVRRRMTRV